MNRPAILVMVGLTVVLGCTGNSGKAGGTSPQGSGGNVAAGGTLTTASSLSGGVAASGGIATSGGVAGGTLPGGTTFTAGGSGSGGAATGGIAIITGGSTSGGATIPGGSAAGAAASGGIATLTGGSSSGGAMGGDSSAGGTAAGGATTGGSSAVTGGVRATGGTTNSGGEAAGGTAGDTADGADSGTAPGGSPASITKDGEVLLTSAGLTIVSYGGYLNGESFQQDGIVSYGGYQYAAFWNVNRHVVLARRSLPSGAWSTLEFTDYSLAADDAHNTISIGICPGDGTLHLSFDHHGNNLHYRKSVSGILANPSIVAWSTSSFSAVTSSLVGSTIVTLVTYPRFVTEPDGNRMLFEARIGASGSGDEYLWEYDATTHAWTGLGMFINGTVDSINAYPHGLSYTRGGARLHMSWCWRDTPDASTNHDLLYIYSDDQGRTWKNNVAATVATTGASFVTKNSAGINVWAINQNRGLINQEHMAVDATGRVHVLLSHMPDAQADDATFTSARTKSQFFHYWRNPSGTWTRTAMGFSVVANFRGKLAISSTGNVYAILPDLRIAAAAAGSNFATWTVLNSVDSGRFFSDPLIDTARLALEDKLTVFYPLKASPNIYALDYTLK